jgi:hypothetical protein
LVVQPESDGKRRHDDRERFPHVDQAFSSTGARERTDGTAFTSTSSYGWVSAPLSPLLISSLSHKILLGFILK